MSSNPGSSSLPDSTRTSDVGVINNGTPKIQRYRKKGDRSKRDSGSESLRRTEFGNTRRRTGSLLDIKNLERDHNELSISERATRENTGEPLREKIGQNISAARRKRRERHRQKAHENSSSTAAVISSVIEDLIEEETHSSARKVGEEDVLVGDWEYTISPPKRKNISYRQYVEQHSNKKFFLRDLNDLVDDEDEHLPRCTYSPVNVAIAVQKCFRPIASLCCGILGGISLWQCCMVIFWNHPDQETFIRYYPDCARVFQSLYYLLAITSLVSVLDSCDFCLGTKRNYWCGMPTKPAPVIISFTLMASLIVSLICAPLDDKLALAVINDWNLGYNMTSAWVNWDIEWWVTINFVRCVGAVLTWMLFSLCLGPDVLWNQLLSLLNVSKNNDKEIIESDKNPMSGNDVRIAP